jgi:hypothetical protein
MAKTNPERDEAIARLHEWLKPGDTVYTIVRHVSRSGMSRDISVVVMTPDGPIHPNWAVARATGMRLVTTGGHDAIRIGGCGMDMGFALVYELGARLWPEGFGCVGDGCNSGTRCRSNDHSNGDRDYTPHDDEVPVRCAACSEPYPCSVQQSRERYRPEAVAAHIAKPSKRHHWHRDGGYALHQEWL